MESECLVKMSVMIDTACDESNVWKVPAQPRTMWGRLLGEYGNEHDERNISEQRDT